MYLLFSSLHIRTPQRDYAGMDYTIEDDLKELIGTTYINKMYLFFSNLSHKNSIVKHAWLGVVIGWVTF